IEHMGKAPFNTVLIHGLVRDDQGRKMSKSLGNGIDPLDIIDQYGADALRMTLVTGNAPGNDMRFYMSRVEASRNFANKVWNASRFIMMNMDGVTVREPALSELHASDRWILSRINSVARDMTENLDKYELGIALSKVYDFIWDEFCDWYIEMAKVRTWKKDEDPESANAALWTLKTVLNEALKLLHPYMPFITEEIYCTLNEDKDTIMLEEWPVYKEEWAFAGDEKSVDLIKEMVTGVRNVRTQMDVPPSRKAKLIIVSDSADVRKTFEDNGEIYVNLAYTSGFEVRSDKSDVPEDAVSVVIPGAVVYIPLSELVDIAKEKERLIKEKERLTRELERSEKMLSNEKFISKAPAEKVQEEKEKQEKYKSLMADVEERLNSLV
ncbi:MAG: class I tRNA ligase family protein, partial [Lachnospiraceae bacterium]|nr:class I tRNA ligase family protein [Lachnospiraceae bacterium]